MLLIAFPSVAVDEVGAVAVCIAFPEDTAAPHVRAEGDVSAGDLAERVGAGGFAAC